MSLVKAEGLDKQEATTSVNGSNPIKKDENLMTEGSIVKTILIFSIPLILGNLLQQMYNTVDSIIVGNYVGIKKDENLMTEGSIVKTILIFSIPLILGNLLQQMYNTVDSIIVGNYVGKNALAAVGSSSSLIYLLIAFSQGISVGSGVIVSQAIGANKEKDIQLSIHTSMAISSSSSLIYLLIAFSQGISVGSGVIVSQAIGANKEKDIQLSIHTSMAISIILGAILSILGFIFTPQILKMMNTPTEVMVESVKYLRLYSLGLIFNVIYNMEAGILNSVGNSKRSLLYLGIASVINIIFDLIFIRGFGLGVEGAAIATNISQAIACIITLGYLVRVNANYKVTLSKIRMHKSVAIRLIKVGLPTGVQNMMISLSNVLIQSSINVFGPIAMAGFGAYLKIDGFNILPVLSFSMASIWSIFKNRWIQHITCIEL